MIAWTVSRPDQSEFAPYAQVYVDLVEGTDIEKALMAQLDSTVSWLRLIDEMVASTYAYAPGKWTVKEVIGHLIDTERIFAYRALCVARADQTSLPGFEQDDYVRVSGANERSLTDLLNEFQAVRRATMALFSGLPCEAWSRRGTVNRYSVTVRGLAFHIAGHELHHLKILREKYLR
jgi:uncharacterized damage-inducible protein DinB